MRQKKYAVRKGKDIRSSLQQLTLINKDLTVSLKAKQGLILLLCKKKNSVPYTMHGSLCQESYLHPYTALEDVCLPDKVETDHMAVKHIAKKVIELKQGGLKGGDVWEKFKELIASSRYSEYVNATGDSLSM